MLTRITQGVKINAMPEVIRLGVNYRVAPHNSLPEIQKTSLKLIQPIVEKYGLTLQAFKGEELDIEVAIDRDTAEPLYDVDYNGTLVLTSTQRTLVAPVSPTSGPVWDLFSGTIQHTFAFEDGAVVPVGELMTGNTDTRHYLSMKAPSSRSIDVLYMTDDIDLTPNIYRWVPTRGGGSENIHTINERINMNNHMEALKFYYDLIRNFDAADI